MGHWEHLKKPFKPGTVIPSNRSKGEWHFTFVDAEGNEYHNRICDYPNAAIAKNAMREFVKKEN